MGVVNVTPDSFSDGGMWFEPAAAVAHGMALLEAGADLIDVGGESTRPGASRPSTEEELRRVLPVISALASAGAVVTIDTMRAEVVRSAAAAGAAAVNDVSGGLADPRMLATVAGESLPYFCMHWRGHAAAMQERASYGDVVADVVRELGPRIQAALTAGIAPDQLAIDPGLGFAKTGEHNWTILRRLDELHTLGLPILVGPSRKAFLGALLAGEDGQPRPAPDRDDATAALSALAALTGVWCVRVHEVRRSLDAVRVAARYAQEWVAPVLSTPDDGQEAT
ncbi:MAG TPA: dihydropteroate synthase [Nocardioidaceae bacterium]|nr:dihydropteroate synthase [Nocardioidaceae bacterium]